MWSTSGRQDVLTTLSSMPIGFFHNYVSTSDMRAYDFENGKSTFQNRLEEFKGGSGVIATKLFACRGLVLQIGDVVFSHADVGATTAENGGQENLKYLNGIAYKYLTTGNATEGELHQIGVFSADASTVWPQNPVWNRSLCKQTGIFDSTWECSKERLDKTKYYVAGHCMQTGRISGRCDNHVWCIDTGRSAAFGADSANTKSQSLEIIIHPSNSRTPPTFRVLGGANNT